MWKLIVFITGLVAVSASPINNARVVGGTSAQIGQFPHQASLRINNLHYCGASILNQNTILTAAHCLYGYDQDNITVVVGTNEASDGGITHSTSRRIIHPKYDHRSSLNDVAVIKLSTKIDFDDLARPIKLADRNPNPGEILTLSGWGLIFFPGVFPRDLQFVQLADVDLETCAEELKGVGQVDKGHVCTISQNGEEAGSCQGDSGGPLINANLEQVGVVSWGIPCATGKPDVYTSIAYYKDWIKTNL